jgi:hypothetical protein
LNCKESCDVTEAETPGAARLAGLPRGGAGGVRHWGFRKKCLQGVRPSGEGQERRDDPVGFCRCAWRQGSSAKEGHLVDALALRGDEGRGTLRKARGRCERSLIPGSPNGATHPRKRVSRTESIGSGGEPGELKHLSSRRKGHQRDSVSSGERTRTRPVVLVSGTGSVWKGAPQRVTAPYGKPAEGSLSRAGHVKSCLNMGGPPSKPKYSSVTDSARVP